GEGAPDSRIVRTPEPAYLLHVLAATRRSRGRELRPAERAGDATGGRRRAKPRSRDKTNAGDGGGRANPYARVHDPENEDRRQRVEVYIATGRIASSPSTSPHAASAASSQDGPAEAAEAREEVRPPPTLGLAAHLAEGTAANYLSTKKYVDQCSIQPSTS
ncbi:hypothetical protein THAOC_26336, partial [Thalassiosira oceanica]